MTDEKDKGSDAPAKDEPAKDESAKDASATKDETSQPDAPTKDSEAPASAKDAREDDAGEAEAKDSADAKDSAEAKDEAVAAKKPTAEEPVAKKKEPAAKKAKSTDEPPPAAKDAPKPKDGEGLAWAKPLVAFDAWWTKWEARLVLAVLGAEIVALSVWVLLKGLSSEWRPGGADASGLVWRGAIGAVALGLIANRVLRPKDAKDAGARRTHQIGVSAAIVLGMVAARFWGSTGSEYFSNFLNWLQSASSLTLIGGLRGVATRLTLWVALLGASLATAQGKHINVDVVMRYVPVKLRVPIAVLGWMTAGLVCATGAYGFVDHLAIAEYRVMEQGPCDANPLETCTFTFGDRMKKVRHEARRDLFLLGRQASLDLKTLPKVLGGTKYKDYLKAKDWNEWLTAEEGWTEYFPKEDVEGQKLDESDPAATRLPIVNVPGGNEDSNGLMRRDADFIFPFGLLMIALRFLLRSILALTGWVKVDPDAAHGDPDIQSAHKAEGDAAEGDAALAKDGGAA
jgi:TRAP-type C4-dicarboxylate transport system permease small subunit